MNCLDIKLERLKSILAGLESVLLAYSGGVDSTLLLRIAREVLGAKVLAVIAESLTYPAAEIEEARKTAANMGARYLIIKTDELSDERFQANPPERCYWCKKELFSKLADLAARHNLRHIVDGANYDDLCDFRPGLLAAGELGVKSPLKEAELGKEEIRILSKKLGLPTWDKPSLACLASRIPFGTKITEKNLLLINQAEDFLRSLRIKQVRVRHYGDTARIEVLAGEINRLLEGKTRNNIVQKFKDLGYRYITVDLEGYRTGSLNPAVEKSKIVQL